ncbi:hypothetical protein DYB32_001224 [Aphanomyces invadans]|uniref:E3 UFM1-protein ligase 1-like N-terminal domain-containing protein n=1 Tax=Aphanomyces invadans TaxID=157072 RepID=A0A3R6ZVV6_9STRA|nr:hypothetical protein DYB32_001224 [Aphanomyces invadans]
MDEIRALQRELAVAQEEKEVFLLSERNIIDILIKLQALQKVELIFTSNAKAVLTPGQLQKEILEHVQSHAGRVSLHELHISINVGMSYIEKYAKEIVNNQSQTNNVHLVGDELISDNYLDTIMAHVRDGVVQDTGFVGWKHPLSCSKSASSPALDEHLVAASLADLIASHAVEGHLRGREFVPTAFVESQRQTIYDFFIANNYLPHALAAQLQVASRPYDFLKKRFPDCIDLDDVVVSGALLLHLEGVVEGLHHDRNSTWLDVRSELPSSAMDAKNAAKLLTKALDRVKAQTKVSPVTSVVQIGGVFAVNAAVLTQTMDKFQDVAKMRASHAAYGALEVGSSDSKANKTKPSTGKASGTKGKAVPHRTICLTHDEQVELIMSWFDHCEGEDEFVAALLESLHDSVEGCFATAAAKAETTIHRGDSYIRRELTERFEAGFHDRVGHLVVFQKAINKLTIKLAMATDGSEGLAVIERAIVRSTGLDLSAWVLQYVNEHHQLELEGVPTILDPHSPQPTMTILSPSHERILKKRVTYASTVVELWRVAQGTSLADLMQHISQVASAMGIPSKKLDRKKEKAIVAAFKQRLGRSLEECVQDVESDFNVILGIVCSLVFFRVTSMALPLPLSASDIQAVYPVLRHAFESSGVAADTIQLVDDMHRAATELQLLQENQVLVRRAMDVLVTA